MEKEGLIDIVGGREKKDSRRSLARACAKDETEIVRKRIFARDSRQDFCVLLFFLCLQQFSLSLEKSFFSLPAFSECFCLEREMQKFLCD